jgi:hypothetical protein
MLEIGKGDAHLFFKTEFLKTEHLFNDQIPLQSHLSLEVWEN